MAWHSSHSSDNKIIDEEVTHPETIHFPAHDRSWSHTVTITQYRYTGMTYAAAVTCEAAMKTAGHEATLLRQNDADAYMVRVTEITDSGYTEITTTTTAP